MDQGKKMLVLAGQKTSLRHCGKTGGRLGGKKEIRDQSKFWTKRVSLGRGLGGAPPGEESEKMQKDKNPQGGLTEGGKIPYRDRKDLGDKKSKTRKKGLVNHRKKNRGLSGKGFWSIGEQKNRVFGEGNTKEGGIHWP